MLGANDGIVSTASLVIGVAAANTSTENILLSGMAGLVAGTMSMAAGEYVSVSSQRDTENADLALEKSSLAEDPKLEMVELEEICVRRGLESGLARVVAEQLMDHDALGAHARDEIGISEMTVAKPIQAALSSATAFAAGAALPLNVAWLITETRLIFAVASSSLVFLALLGGIAA